MAIKPFQTNDLYTCLKDKDTVAKKVDDYVELTLKVTKNVSVDAFNTAIDKAEKAETIATEKTFLETEKTKYYPDKPVEEVVEEVVEK